MNYYTELCEIRLKIEHILHTQETAVVLYEFGCKDCAKGKAVTVLCVVGYCDRIGIRGVGNSVYAGNLVAAHCIYTQFIIGRLITFCHAAVGVYYVAKNPGTLSVEVLKDAFGKSDSRAAGGVELVDMVGLLHLHAVAGEAVHNLGKIAVDSRKDSHIRRFLERSSRKER